MGNGHQRSREFVFMAVQEQVLNPSKHGMRGRRLDWLAQQLITKVTGYYLQRQHAKAAYFKGSPAACEGCCADGAKCS